MLFSSKERDQVFSEICGSRTYTRDEEAAKQRNIGVLFDTEAAEYQARERQPQVSQREREGAVNRRFWEALDLERARKPEPPPIPEQKPFKFEDVIRKEDTKLFDFPISQPEHRPSFSLIQCLKQFWKEVSV